MSLKQSFLMHVGLWCLTRIFSYIDVYVPDRITDEVVAITFSNDEKYIKLVSKLEENKNDNES